MRQDFVYHLPVSIAQRVSNKKRKRSILTGAIVATFALRYWIAGLAILKVILILSKQNLLSRRINQVDFKKFGFSISRIQTVLKNNLKKRPSSLLEFPSI